MSNNTAKQINWTAALKATAWFIAVYAIVSLIFFLLNLFLFKFNNPGLMYWLTIIGAPFAFLVGGTMVWGYRQRLEVGWRSGVFTFLLCTALLLALERLFGTPQNIYLLNVCGSFATEGVYTMLKKGAAEMPLVAWYFDAIYAFLFTFAVSVPHDIGTKNTKKSAKGKKKK